MTMHRLPRREFIMEALAACGAPFFAQALSAQSSQRPGRVGADRGSQLAVGYLGAGSLLAAQQIGEAFVAHLSIEKTNEAILDAAGTTLQLIAATPGATAAITALAQNVRRDFRNERYVQLQGWVLSRTELDLCLLALLPFSP